MLTFINWGISEKSRTQSLGHPLTQSPNVFGSPGIEGFVSELVLLDSEHRLRILHQLRTILIMITICWPTKWQRQHWQ